MGRLMPDYHYDSVFQVAYEELLEKNIRNLIFDIDNTLAAYEHKTPTAKVVALIRRLKRMGFNVCLLTNNTNKRLQHFDKTLELTGIANALKPLSRGVQRAMGILGSTPATTAIIGDQLLSDIWAGKNAGITTVLVKPLSQKDLAFVHLKRVVERRLLRKYFGNEYFDNTKP